MALSIISTETLECGFFRVIIMLDDGSYRDFQFPLYMPHEEMKEKALEVLAKENEGKVARDTEKNRLNLITKAVEKYFLGQLTNNQKVQLLDVLANEWREEWQ